MAVELRQVVVYGTGLIGTSIALAVREAGVRTFLVDSAPGVARTAAARGAGEAGEPDALVDLAVIAVPPARVADVLIDAQRRGVARAYTDVASVKALPLERVIAAGCDLSSYVGGHPLAGRERSGPMAARADLFVGRPWVLTPSSASGGQARGLATALVELCGATPVEMEPDAHDHAVALVSHAPHLLAALMAARLEHAPDSAVRLSGQGVRDVTRIAAGDRALWEEILGANADAVADVLEAVADDLSGAVAALRRIAGADGERARLELAEVLRRGNTGHARIPGKHGAPPAPYSVVPVLIGDQPGELARLFSDAGEAKLNIEDVRIEHSPNQRAGLVELLVNADRAEDLAAELRERGWDVQG
jgi:prephenate dehydrogenase